MRDYFICIFAAALISGAICMAATGTAFEKSVKYLCALLCALTVMSPLAEISLKGISLPSAETVSAADTTSAVTAEAERQVGDYISSLLFERFGISGAGVSIDLYSEDGTVYVGNVTVTLPSGSDAAGVRSYLKEALGGEICVGCENAD